MNKCKITWLSGPTADNGYLPDNLFEYDWGWFWIKVGCTNLRCAKCGQKVRSLTGAEVDGSVPLAEIHAAPDLAAHPGVRPGDRWNRLYLCRCHAESVAGVTEATEYEDYLRPPRRPPWECDGHPPWELPAVLDGIAVHAGMDFPSLVARLPPDFWPPPLPLMKQADLCGFWLGRLWGLLSDPAMRQELVEAVTGLLANPEPARRAAALGFFHGCPELATERTIALFHEHLAFFVGHPDPTRPGRTLDERLIRLLDNMLSLEGDLSPREQTALSFQQELALTGRYHEAYLHRIHKWAPTWVHDHARELARVSSQWLDAVVHLVCRAHEVDAVPAAGKPRGRPGPRSRQAPIRGPRFPGPTPPSIGSQARRHPRDFSRPSEGRRVTDSHRRSLSGGAVLPAALAASRSNGKLTVPLRYWRWFSENCSASKAPGLHPWVHAHSC